MDFRRIFYFMFIIFICLLQVYISEAARFGGFRVRIARYTRYTYTSYYYYYSSYYDDTLSVGAIVGIVIGCISGVIIFIVGCVLCCVCCCSNNSSTTGQVVQQQQPGVTTISSTQMSSINTVNTSTLNQQQYPTMPQNQPQDGFKYSAPPPAYGEATNYGFQPT